MKKKYFILYMFVIPLMFSACKKGNITLIEVSYDVRNCSLPYIVQFSSTVHYQPSDIQYTWDFGDGTTSSDKNPVHAYTEAGVYNVKLKVQNYEDTEEKTIAIAELNSESVSVVSEFSYESVYNMYAPAELIFYNESMYETEVLWNFGDGYGSSAIDSAIHTYDVEGDFDVILEAICNGDTAISSLTVNILPPPPEIILSEVKLWLPGQFSGIIVDISVTYGIHDETPLSFEPLFAGSFPVRWLNTEQIGPELFFFDGEYDSEWLSILFEDDETGNDIYTVRFQMMELAENHYPDILTFDDGNGYAAEINLIYSD